MEERGAPSKTLGSINSDLYGFPASVTKERKGMRKILDSREKRGNPMHSFPISMLFAGT